jgi:hypothetical protein
VQVYQETTLFEGKEEFAHNLFGIDKLCAYRDDCVVANDAGGELGDVAGL